MYRTLTVGLMAGTVFLLLSVQPAWAQGEHLVQATDHAQQAAGHGEMGHAEILVQHAAAALTHAEVAGDDNPYTVAAVASLRDALNMGRMPLFHTHAEQALAHARAAAEIADSAHINLAIEGFEEAIMHGEMEHSGPAVKSAETAMSHLHM